MLTFPILLLVVGVECHTDNTLSLSPSTQHLHTTSLWKNDFSVSFRSCFGICMSNGGDFNLQHL